MGAYAGLHGRGAESRAAWRRHGAPNGRCFISLTVIGTVWPERRAKASGSHCGRLGESAPGPAATMALRMAGNDPTAVPRRPRQGQGHLEKRSSRPEADPCAGRVARAAAVSASGSRWRSSGSSSWAWSGASSATCRSRTGSKANARLPRAASRALARHDGSLLSDGHDPRHRHGAASAVGGMQDAPTPAPAAGPTRAHRLSASSPFPRDLRVEIPGYGTAKINAANQLGGPALTIETVKELTGLPVRHVVVVDFDGFQEPIGDRRHRGERPPADPLEQFMLCLGRAVPRMGGLALRRRARSTWTGAARSCTRASGTRTSSTRPRRTFLAAADSRPWPRRSATRSR